MSLNSHSDQLSLEDLVRGFRANGDHRIFDELFTRCHRELMKFLLSKKVSPDDAEDLLQDYFIHDFDRSLEKYDESRQKKFINYVRHIVLLRFFTLFKKRKKENELTEFSLDDAMPHEEYALSSSVMSQNQDDGSITLMREEIKEFFREAVLSIKNDKHRGAVILRLCIPIKLSTEEASEILNCSSSSYSTWTYRGILELRQRVEEQKESMFFDLDEVLQFVKEESFAIKRDILDEITDADKRTLLSDYLFAGKNYSVLGRERNLPEDDVKSLVRKGIFEILNLLNKPELLFRKGGDMYIEQDNVIQYLDSLDSLVTDSSRDIKTRHSVTTGDETLDTMLSAVHTLFRRDNSGDDHDSLKDMFLERLNRDKLSIDDVIKSHQVKAEEIQALLMEDGTLSEDSRQKLITFIGEVNISETESNKIETNQFDSVSETLLQKYYREKDNVS